MNRGNLFNWLFLAVWATWLCALSGHWTQFSWMGNWAPQLQIALIVALAARAPVGHLPFLALTLGLAHIAVSVDSPAAILAAALGTGALLRLARGGIQIESAPVAGLLAFVIATVECAWFEFVHLRTSAAPIADWSEIELGWRAGLSTALATIVLGRVMVNLPGVGSLLRRKTWAVGASLH